MFPRITHSGIKRFFTVFIEHSNGVVVVFLLAVAFVVSFESESYKLAKEYIKAKKRKVCPEVKFVD